jgi:hypothetical protein
VPTARSATAGRFGYNASARCRVKWHVVLFTSVLPGVAIGTEKIISVYVTVTVVIDAVVADLTATPIDIGIIIITVKSATNDGRTAIIVVVYERNRSSHKGLRRPRIGRYNSRPSNRRPVAKPILLKQKRADSMIPGPKTLPKESLSATHLPRASMRQLLY